MTVKVVLGQVYFLWAAAVVTDSLFSPDRRRCQ